MPLIRTSCGWPNAISEQSFDALPAAGSRLQLVLHRPYPKISQTLAHVALGDSRWIATEKIHGAQFVVATDGIEVAFGKRDDEEGARLRSALLELVACLA
jgi:hypothetical protein